MFHGIFCSRSNVLVYALVACSIACTQSIPLNALEYSIGDVARVARIKSLIEKIKSHQDNSKKVIGYFIEIKSEIEAYTGKSFDISKALKNVSEIFKQRTGKAISKRTLSEMKKLLTKADKKHKSYFEYVDTEVVNGEVTDYFYDDYKGGPVDDVNFMPTSVIVGITIACAGGFLVLIPPFEVIGGSLVTFGVGMAIQGGCETADDLRKK